MGVLGWPPSVVDFTNIPDLLLAYEAKITWHNQTNGVKEKEKGPTLDATLENFDNLTSMR